MARIIAIFSTKGGVGKTLLAANLGVSLVKDEAKKVLIIDFDMHGVGDMARMLNLEFHKGRTAVDIIHILKHEGLPENFKRDFFLSRHSSGVDFLPGVFTPSQAMHFDAERIKDVIAIYESQYDYIIIDVGRLFNDTLISTFNLANLIFLVSTPDILSVYQTKWALDTLQYLRFPLAMIKVVLNRAESISSISSQEIITNLPVEISCRIPSDGRIVGQAVNSSIPVVIDTPKAKISQCLKGLAHQLATNDDMFTKPADIDQVKLKEAIIEQTSEFWQKHGLVEPLTPPPTEDLDEVILLKRRVHTRLIEKLDLKKLDLKIFSDPKMAKDLRNKAEVVVTNLLTEETGTFISSTIVRQKLVKEILDEALGLGPLEDFLVDPSITDIMVNNKDEVYVERFGKIEYTTKKFISNDQVRIIIERIIAPIGRRIDESVPMVDARLPDGSRVNAIIHPLALTGPTLTIRKFRQERFKVEELIEMNTLNAAMADFLRACVICRKNVIVSGGTGSGKTTILNVLSEFIPDRERIITIEDAAELKLHQRHWIRLESRPSNIEGKGSITIRDLFRNTLRMRPDRIIIGECRSVETLDMLQAMNTGHDGSMTTVHANSTHDVLVRLDSMILMSGIELPIRAIREMITSAIDVIVHTARLSDGSRKIIQISEVVGMKDELHADLQDVFTFKQDRMDKEGKIYGNFEATGYIPTFIDEIKLKGIPLPENVFKSV